MHLMQDVAFLDITTGALDLVAAIPFGSKCRVMFLSRCKMQAKFYQSMSNYLKQF